MEVNDPQENYKTGYVWLYRSLKDKSFFKKPDYLALWILLLFKATRKELKLEVWFRGQLFFLKPGQLLTGRKKLSEESGIHESKIERILTYFEKNEQQIEQQKSTKNRLISIVNWGQYQWSEQQIEQQANNERTTSEQQINNERTTNEQQVNTDKKEEKDKKDKKGKNVENEKKEEKEKKNPLHSQCVKIYFDWYKKKFDLEPQFDGSDGKAMNKIIEFIKKNVKKTEKTAENGVEVNDEIISNSWQVILDKYESWDKFFRKQRRVRQIESNLSNIINNIRYGTKGATTADFSDGIREYLRKRGDKI